MFGIVFPIIIFLMLRRRRGPRSPRLGGPVWKGIWDGHAASSPVFSLEPGLTPQAVGALGPWFKHHVERHNPRRRDEEPAGFSSLAAMQWGRWCLSFLRTQWAF